MGHDKTCHVIKEGDYFEQTNDKVTCDYIFACKRKIFLSISNDECHLYIFSELLDHCVT